MTETTISRLLIAAPQGVAAKLEGILATAHITPAAVYCTGGEALARAHEHALLLTSWRLPDMTGPELVKKMPAAGVMMIVPGDYDPAELEGADVLTLHNPISQDALIQAVRAMCYCGAKMQALEIKALRLERQLSERKVIERAKGRLMDALRLSEKEAHYRIQKKSMDTGRRIVDIAQEILDSKEIAV
ncbi:MAG: ANTAR domain-containing protein [Clostridia bacterium]|nr:ANTAR domain-containing protein [Clostridia bacterium]